MKEKFDWDYVRLVIVIMIFLSIIVAILWPAKRIQDIDCDDYRMLSQMIELGSSDNEYQPLFIISSFLDAQGFENESNIMFCTAKAMSNNVYDDCIVDGSLILRNIRKGLEKMSMKETLYKKASNGKIVEWSILVSGNMITTFYGDVNGVKSKSVKIIKEGKNIGKSNETSPEQQAMLQGKSMYKKKIDKGYFKTISEAKSNNLIKPMLAVKYNDKRVSFPVAVQPKLDGVRCLAMKVDGNVKLLSRSGKEYNLPHIQEALQNTLPDNIVLDGEIFNRALSFQEITSLVKKYRKESEALNYWIYDMINLENKDIIFALRFTTIENIIRNQHKSLIETPTFTVISLEELQKIHAQFVKDGFEGTIIRSHFGKYEMGKRSWSLMKLKNFDDNEFVIVDYAPSIQNGINVPLFVCENKDGKLFNVFMSGTMEQKAEVMSHIDDYIGKLLKVKHFGYTERGIPRFPVGIGIRTKEDLD